MSVRWRIELLGAFRVEREGQDGFRFATRKTAALLAYLAYHPHKALARETLADQFWPDHEPESARNSLRVALNALRKLFDGADGPHPDGGELLSTDRASVRLNPAVFSTDVADFEALLRAERDAKDPQQQRELLLKAALLYQGPLLAGWYEEWVGGEQTRLAEVYGSALRRLTGLLIETREFDRAMDFARRAIAADPLREDTHRLMIRLHALTGNTAGALAQYRELETRLQNDLATSPSRVTRELMRQILSADKDASPPSPASETVVTPPTPTPKIVTPAPKEIGAPKPAPLPRPMTRFFGREAEIASLRDMLAPERGDCCRLVTLTGMGGTGKTRLALEVATRFADTLQTSGDAPANATTGFNGGIWVVPLAEVSSPLQLEAAVASALRLRTDAALPNDGDGLWEKIRQALNGTAGDAPRPTLLVLDNFEQLVEGGADWLARLMEACPGLTCLVTSRQRLDIAGEQEVPLTPLPVPSSEAAVPPQAAADFPSVRLFVDRARAVRPDFALNERSAPQVAELCARLDGLPLAIELAAAWARLLTPAQMLTRLNARFDLLIAAQRDIAPRHRSLRAVLDETYRLMPDDLRQVFAGLSVFHGGISLDAAEAVLPQKSHADMLEMLALLQQRSLVSVVETGEQVRFRMLETVRDYAATLLEPPQAAQLRAAHARYFADFARGAAPHLNRRDNEGWLTRMDDEQDNLRAALEGDAPDANLSLPPMAASLWRYWYARGRAEEGLAALEKQLAHTANTSPVSRAQLCEGAGRLALALGQGSRACQVLQEGLSVLDGASEEHADRIRGPLAANLALAAQAAGDPRTASIAYGQVLAQKRAQCDVWGAACALSEMGESLLQLGDGAAAVPVFTEAADLHEVMGDRERARECRASLRRAQGKADAPVDAAAGQPGAFAQSYLTLGHVAYEQEDFTVALPLLEEARRGFLASGSTSGVTLTCERIGLAALEAGDTPRALSVLEEARARRRAEGDSQSDLDGCRAEHLQWLDALLTRARVAR